MFIHRFYIMSAIFNFNLTNTVGLKFQLLPRGNILITVVSIRIIEEKKQFQFYRALRPIFLLSIFIFSYTAHGRR